MTTDGAFAVTNWIYLVSLFVAAAASVALWRLSILSGEEKDRQLDRYKTEAWETVAHAQSVGEQAKADAAKANERAAVLEKEAAEARVEQERLRNRGLELEAQLKKIGPRILTAEQRTAMALSISHEPIRPGIRFDFAQDAETIEYAQALANVFTGNGLTGEIGNQTIAGGHFGLAVMDRTVVVHRALKAAGIEFSEQKMDPDESKTVFSVGRKPPQ